MVFPLKEERLYYKMWVVPKGQNVTAQQLKRRKVAKVYEKESSLRLVDLSRLVGRLKLGVGPAARLCGVSVKQLLHWSNRGYIQCQRDSPGSDRVYDYAAVKKGNLIQQAMAKGYRLEQAIKLAESFLERQVEKQVELETMPDEEIRRLIEARAEQLKQLASRIRIGLSIYRVGGTLRQQAFSGDLGEIIIFLESNPYSVFTAHEIGLKIQRPTDLVQRGLKFLEESRFVHKIRFPQRDVYRYIPRRRRLLVNGGAQ